MGGNLGSVAAHAHTAPSPRVRARMIGEHQCAITSLTRLYLSEIFRDDELDNRLTYGHQ
jgi:hypothetical protein